MTLTEFLTARLGEDETTARAAVGTQWRVVPSGPYTEANVLNELDEYVVGHFPCREDGHPDAGGATSVDAAHIARWDPARVLREVEAKRKILAEHSLRTWGVDDDHHECRICITDQSDYADMWLSDRWPCATLRALAAVWSGHPDYDPVWVTA